MRTMLWRLGGRLPAGTAILFLAACGGTSTPTAPVEAVTASKATVTAAAEPVSVTVRGAVVDSSNRPLANITIECPGDVQCTGRPSEVGAEGHGHQVEKTDANGRYEIVATSGTGAAASGFPINANGRGYQVEWRQVEWPGPACTWDQPRCALTVDFRLTPVSD